MSGRKVLQAEKSTSVEYLRYECDWKVPGKLGWPVYLKQHEREGEDWEMRYNGEESGMPSVVLWVMVRSLSVLDYFSIRLQQTISRHSGLGFPRGSVVKNLPASARDVGLIPDLGRSHRLQRN